MNNMVFENHGTNTYLVYQIGPEDELDTMSLGMLTNNAIPGFAPVTFTQMDDQRFIKYNVTAKVSVAQMFSGHVNKKRLVGVLSGIVNAMIAAEDYMLDSNDMLLDLDHIFADVSTCETEVICLPIMNSGHKNPELGVFFKNIIFSTQFDQTENCDHVAQILNYLNGAPVISLYNFKEVLDSISKGAVAARPQPAPQPQPVVQQQPATKPVPAPKTAPVQPAANAAPPQPRPVAPVQQVPPRNVPPVRPNRNVPGPAVPPQPQNVPPAQPADKGEKMSMMYLLQHYNKENAAIYKAQKEAKKAQKAASAPAPMPQAAPRPNVPNAVPGQQPPAPGGFAVPGKQPPAPGGFAVPGKQPPAPGGFAVPGKQPPAPGGFAVPGQQPPAPGGFAVPGQQPPMPGKPPVAPAGVPAQGQMQRPPMPGANQQMPPMNGAQQPPRPVQPVQPVQPMPAYQPPVQNGGTPLNFGETTVLGGAIGETTVLGAVPAAAKPAPHLVRLKNNEKIPINKPVFRIGKERSYVDYFIGDNTAISRSHANIVDHDGEFFVVDTNSTNHTYVNGGMIASNTETKLTHGTKIRFANEEFEFKMY